MYMQRTTSGAAVNGLYKTIKYMRGAAGIGLGTTIKHLRRTRPGHHDQIPATHNERRREQRPGHHDEVPRELNAGASKNLAKARINYAEPSLWCSSFYSELRATPLGPFACGARAFSL